LKGALFIEAGNVWLFDERLPGGKFHWDDILDEMAVGSGFGIRLDASVFVLRLDLGVPLRKPWLPPDNRWVINEINPSSKPWRRENLVLNIAIGYPF
jgi:outer membrane protein insertion porin family